MDKYISKFILALILLILVFLVLFPYFTSSFLNLRQQKENEENYQKLLKEQKTLREAEQKNYLMGKFDPAQKEDFILVPREYTTVENKMYLRKETFEAYLEMQNAAVLDNVHLKIASATRNFIYQKNIWNKKWSGATTVDGQNLSKSISDGLERFKKILEYSAVPGTSRHHWGTEIDINDSIPSYFDGNKGKREYDWLIENAYLFGFCQTYNLKDVGRPDGYNEEKWHWSYLPLARVFTQEYKDLIKAGDIEGFLGDEHVSSLDLINDYVLSINPECI